MLVLTRKLNESIMLGGDIEIIITEISPTQVRLGIKAPRKLEVLRKEIYDSVSAENRKAAACNHGGRDDAKQLSKELRGYLNKA